jgi:hypothetical protein
MLSLRCPAFLLVGSRGGGLQGANRGRGVQAVLVHIHHRAGDARPTST